MRNFVLNEVGIDHSHNLPTQRLILFKAARIEDLEPDFEFRVTHENCRILLVVFPAPQEPALVRVWIFWVEIRIQALDKVPRQTIVHPRAIVLAKDDPGLAVRISDDMLSICSGAGDEEGPV